MSTTEFTRQESASTSEALRDEIQLTYDRVFANGDNFKNYFFGTPDITSRDVQVRLGVFLKRLAEVPSERFWFFRKWHRDVDYGETSIHNIDGNRRNNFRLNGFLQAELEEWEKQQPSEMEKFLEGLVEILKQKYLLKSPGGEGGPMIIYNYPKVEVTQKAVESVVDVVLPGSEKKTQNYSSTRSRVEIKAPSFKCSINIDEHEIFGKHLSVHISDFGGIEIDEAMKAEYGRYYRDEVIPVLLENAIRGLDPTDIRRYINSGIGGPRVLERLIWTPKTFHREDDSRNGKYHTGGYGVDLEVKFAEEFGLVPRGVNFDHTFAGGWFLTTEQLWHGLFGVDYPGSVNLGTKDSDSKALTIKGDKMTETHKLVLKNIGSDSDDSRVQEFLDHAETVIASYRFFTDSDYGRFVFPEDYRPIAVSLDGEFAIGFKEVEGGTEICFQLPSETIISQIECRQANNTKSIRNLETLNSDLEKLKQSYI